MTPMIEFKEHLGVHTGVGHGGRVWRIINSFAGWRMEFRDTGDTHPTYAGLHSSLQSAQAEANRPTSRGQQRAPRGT